MLRLLIIILVIWLIISYGSNFIDTVSTDGLKSVVEQLWNGKESQ